MKQAESTSDEAAAIARVADAAREVQAASTRLQTHFKERSEDVPTLLLACLAATMHELQAARDSFDALLASKP